MSWRDSLRLASFRGAAFLVKSSSGQFGRRVQLNEYPLRDLPWGEDLGRKARGFSLEAYVLEPLPSDKSGKTYFDLRDALIAALEAPGPGTLSHPFLGQQQVVVMGPATVTENFEQGGMARFSIPFMEAGSLIEPASNADTAGACFGASVAAQTALQADFSTAFSASNLPSWINNPTLTKLGALTRQLNGFENTVNAVPTAMQSYLQQVASFGGAVSALIATPSALASQLVGAINAVATIVLEPFDALKLYKNGLFSFGSTDSFPPAPSPLIGQQQANNQAINTLVVAAALTQHAALSSQVPTHSAAVSYSGGNPVTTIAQNGTQPQEGYDSSNAALQTLADFQNTLATLLPNLSDASYAAMLDLRAAMVADLRTRAAALPTLVSFTPAITMPSLVIAQRLYGDATRSDEIVLRNDVPKPGFVTGGYPLEVLNG